MKKFRKIIVLGSGALKIGEAGESFSVLSFLAPAKNLGKTYDAAHHKSC